MRRIVSPLALMLAALAIPGLAAHPAAAVAAPGTTAQGKQLWVSRYGAPANDDQAFSIAVSPNGGTVYTTGTSFSGATYGKNATGTDYRTIAYNGATGARLWVARYNGPGNSTDDPYSIAVSPDGRTVFVTGASAGKRTGFEYATVAYRAATGAQLWVARYGAPGNTDSEAHSIAVSPNGRAVYVTGYSRGISAYAYATVAYNASTGARLWVKRYQPGNGINDAVSLAVGPDGRSVYVTGNIATAAYTSDYATIAYNAANGAQRWLRRYNGPGHGTDRARSLAVSPDGRTVYVTGESVGSGTGFDYATIAYNTANGAQRWLRRYNGPVGGDDLGESVAVSPDGGKVYVTGWSSNGTPPGYLTVAYQASNGAQLWAQPYANPAGNSFMATSVAVGPAGKSVYVTGWTTTASGWAYGTVAYAAGTGTQLWSHTYPTTNDISYGPVLTVSRATGRVYVVGTTPVGDGADYLTIAYGG